MSDTATTPDDRVFRQLFESMPQLGWTALADGYIDFYNRGWFEYTGTTPAQMVGWGWRSVHDPNVLPRVEEEWRRCIASGEPFEMEFPLRRHDGLFRSFLTRVTPLRDEDGKITRWVGVNTDVEDVRAAHALRDEMVAQGRDVTKMLLFMRSAKEAAEARVVELEAEIEKVRAAVSLAAYR